jgi:hypothetical protein
MIDVDVFPSDTSWLSEPTTGVHQSEEVHLKARLKVTMLREISPSNKTVLVGRVLEAGRIEPSFSIARTIRLCRFWNTVARGQSAERARINITISRNQKSL